MTTKTKRTSLIGPLYIGIDQSYTGFAMTAINDRGQHYTEVFKSKSKGMERMSEIKSFLISFLGDYPPIAIAMEGYAFGSTMSHQLGELGGMVKLVLWEMYTRPECRQPLIVPPTSLKKYITGKGSVQKNQILMHVFKKWGIEMLDDNAADSYGLARIVRNKHDHAYEREVYEKLTLPG